MRVFFIHKHDLDFYFSIYYNIFIRILGQNKLLTLGVIYTSAEPEVKAEKVLVASFVTAFCRLTLWVGDRLQTDNGRRWQRWCTRC